MKPASVLLPCYSERRFSAAKKFLIAKIGVDAAENGPRKERCVVAKVRVPVQPPAEPPVEPGLAARQPAGLRRALAVQRALVPVLSRV